MTPKPFLLILAALLLVAPALASYEITAEPLGGTLHTSGTKFSDYTIDETANGDALQRISWDLPTGTTVNYTLTYGNSETVSGWFEYTNDGFYTQHTEVAIGGIASGYDYWGLQEIGRVDIVGYARDTNTNQRGIIVYDSVFGFSERRAISFYQTSNVSDGVIYKVHFTSNKPIGFAWYSNTRANVAKAADTSLLDVVNEWVQLAESIASFIYNTVVTLLYWLKFFFWDNLMMTVALYIAITAAVAFNKTKDVFKGIQQFFKYQRALFEFILILWSYLVNLIATFRGIFRI